MPAELVKSVPGSLASRTALVRVMDRWLVGETARLFGAEGGASAADEANARRVSRAVKA